MTTNKEWCSHIEMLGEQWFLKKGTSLTFVQDDWDTCPVKDCNAKRPEEPKALWKIMAEQRDIDDGGADLAEVAIEWFKKNFPDFIQQNSAYAYKGRILDWLDKEIEKCR